MDSLLQVKTAIARRAGELSKIGMRRYQAENKLLIHPSMSGSHSSSMDRIRAVSDLRCKLHEDLAEVREEFLKVACLPLEHWIL